MAMIFEMAQSASLNMEYLFTFYNLSLYRMGLECNSKFAEKLNELEDYNTFNTIPSRMCQLVLDEIFDSTYLEEDESHKTEVINIEDQLFNFISSGSYKATSISTRLKSVLDELAWTMTTDLYYTLEEFLDGDEDIFDFIDDEDVSGANLLKAFDGESFKLHIYHTEDLICVTECLKNLKEVLLLVKEEIDANNKNVAA